jgi:hypothetical protein
MGPSQESSHFPFISVSGRFGGLSYHRLAWIANHTDLRPGGLTQLQGQFQSFTWRQATPIAHSFLRVIRNIGPVEFALIHFVHHAISGTHCSSVGGSACGFGIQSTFKFWKYDSQILRPETFSTAQVRWCSANWYILLLYIIGVLP